MKIMWGTYHYRSAYRQADLLHFYEGSEPGVPVAQLIVQQIYGTRLGHNLGYEWLSALCSVRQGQNSHQTFRRSDFAHVIGWLSEIEPFHIYRCFFTG